MTPLYVYPCNECKPVWKSEETQGICFAMGFVTQRMMERTAFAEYGERIMCCQFPCNPFAFSYLVTRSPSLWVRLYKRGSGHYHCLVLEKLHALVSRYDLAAETQT